LVDGRHLGGLAADEDDAALHALVGHAAHDLLHHRHVQLPPGEVIQEKRGLAPCTRISSME
jgi:hypothetical protein